MQEKYCTKNIGHLHTDRKDIVESFCFFRRSNIQSRTYISFAKIYREIRKTSVMDIEFPAIGGLRFYFS
jgi:hypothetical protein